MLDITDLLTRLAESRNVFYSEADFQHALAWRIHEDNRDCQIRLEVPMPVPHRKMYVDIWLPEEKIAIELKYVTRSLELEHKGESFTLRYQGAQNHRRYDFLQDIQRLECLRRSVPGLCEAGYAVLLTNDPLYWNDPRNPDTVDSAFRIHEKQMICGERAWNCRASPGTVKGRESSILLEGSYHLRWQDYSQIPKLSEKEPGKFRYLAVSVH